MKILILAATGRVSSYLIPDLLNKTDDDLVLFGHNVDKRLQKYQGNDRVTLVNGDLGNIDEIKAAAQGVDFAVLNLMTGNPVTSNAVEALEDSSCDRLVVTGGHCAPDDAIGERSVNNSKLNTTYIHAPWYTDSDEVSYRVTHEDNDGSHHVSRASVADFITKLAQDPSKYANDDLTLYMD